MRLKVLVCSSGELGFNTLLKIEPDISIIGVLTDAASLKIINWTIGKGIPLFVGNPRGKKKKSFIESIENADVLLSINYLFIIEKDLIDFPKIAAINIHGSKLPLYRGRAPHIWAIINGERAVGITVHKIDEGCDTGDIILQSEIALTESTTGGDILDIYAKEYPKMLNSVLASISINTLKSYKQDHSVATYFGKRSPEDGEIVWDWDSERIKNWVRALTAPYPGAFTYLKGQQVFIWKIEESDFDSNNLAKNGTVVKVDNDIIFVQGANKVLKVTSLTKSNDLLISVGDVLQGEKNYE